jgi:hypothetical protein
MQSINMRVLVKNLCKALCLSCIKELNSPSFLDVFEKLFLNVKLQLGSCLAALPGCLVFLDGIKGGLPAFELLLDLVSICKSVGKHGDQSSLANLCFISESHCAEDLLWKI